MGLPIDLILGWVFLAVVVIVIGVNVYICVVVFAILIISKAHAATSDFISNVDSVLILFYIHISV